MRWYFASRTKHKEKIKAICKELISQSDEISYNWTLESPLIPYHENSRKSIDVAISISQAIEVTDIFVLLSDLGGTDMFIELGIAISNALEMGIPKIYVVGENNKRSLMHFHPKINHVNNLEELFFEEGLIYEPNPIRIRYLD